MLFLAGHERSVSSKASLGFHKPLLGALDGREADVEVMLGAMKGFGAPEEFLARIRALRGRAVWYPSSDELFRYNVITSPVTSDAFR
jgi:hypothetical protein